MPLSSKAWSNRPPSLLPAASLEGLEKFVHPDETWPVDQKDPWKYKPLPDLPRASSSDYSRSIVSLDSEPRNGAYDQMHDLNTSQDSLVSGRINQRSFPGTNGRRRTPITNLKEQFQQASTGRRGRWILRQSSSPALSQYNPWLDKHSFHGTEVSWTPAATVCMRRDSLASQHVNSVPPDSPTIVPPLSPRTVDSFDPSLIPRPLGVDSVQGEGDGEIGKPKGRSPLLIVENSDPDICLCHSPHPRHDRVPSRVTSIQRENLPLPPLPSSPGSLLSKGRGSQVIGTPKKLNKEEKSKIEPKKVVCQSIKSVGPNRTQLCSFCTTTTADLRNARTPIQGAHDSYILEVEQPRAPHPSPRLSRCSSLPQILSSRRNQPTPTKHIAIPPTDYQKYGPQALAENRKAAKAKRKEKGQKDNRESKKRGISRLPRYLRKILPKAFSSESLKTTTPPPDLEKLHPRPSTPAIHQAFASPPPYPYQYSDGKNIHYSRRPSARRKKELQSDEWGLIKDSRKKNEWQGTRDERGRAGGSKKGRKGNKGKGKEKGKRAAHVRDENGSYWL
ncbi:hypothetical protein LOZ66_005810 [Ophidiomyces ophidiicola]|nr:hypothetical protein LOZ66_005810 [Ophidiomyces ophidiicola]